jgi:hypothetical protein
VLSTLAHEAAGATGTRRFLRPLSGGSFMQNSDALRRENVEPCLAVIPGRCEASNPESRDSGLRFAHPGMTIIVLFEI